MDLNTQLNQLESAELVHRLSDEDSTYIFKHALVQDTAYGLMLKNRRRDTHRRIVAVYEQIYADRLDEFAAFLSNQCWNGELWEQTAHYAIRAGENALRVYALREAVDDFERALVAMSYLSSPVPLQMFDALVGWAEAALRIRPYAEQLEHLERAEKIARDLNDKRRLVRVLYRIGIVHITQGHNLRASPPLTECFSLANELDDEQLVVIPTLYMGLATVYTDPQQAIHLFERAIELATKYDDLNTLALAWSAKAMTHARLGESSSAHAALDRAFDLMDQLKSPSAQSDVYLFSAWAFLDLGNWQKGLEYGQLCVKTASAAANLDCMCGGFDVIGFNRLAEQNLPQAIEIFKEAIKSSQFSGAEVFENLGRAGLATAEYYSGKTSALVDLEHAYSHAKELNDESQSAMMAQTLGEIFASGSDPVKAENYLIESIDFFRRTHITPYLVRSLKTLEQVYTQQERASEAEQARAEILRSQNSMDMEKATREN